MTSNLLLALLPPTATIVEEVECAGGALRRHQAAQRLLALPPSGKKLAPAPQDWLNPLACLLPAASMLTGLTSTLVY